MIWATVSSWSCFCWLYRASPSLAAKNIINLISVVTIWWCPCVESSLVLLDEGVCYDQCILLAELYEPLLCFIEYSKAKFACYPRCFLTSYFCIPVPYTFLGVSSKRSVGDRKELPHDWGQGQKPRGASPHPRSGGCTRVGGYRGATPCSRSGGVAVRRYPSSKVRSSGCALLE